MLTEQQIEQYHRDGYLMLPAHFDAAHVKRMQAAADTLGDSVGPLEPDNPYVQLDPFENGYRIRQLWPVTEVSPAFAELLNDPKLIEPFADLFGEKPVLFEDKLNYKHPHGGSAFPMHQDFAYWRKYTPTLASAFIYLDAATEENGCLEVVPGRHRDGLIPVQTERVSAIRTTPNAIATETVDRTQTVKATGPAGSMLIFSCMTPHMSKPNESDEPRRAMIYTFHPASAGRGFRADQLSTKRGRMDQWVRNHAVARVTGG